MGVQWRQQVLDRCLTIYLLNHALQLRGHVLQTGSQDVSV
jgi:hypothetical protein